MQQALYRSYRPEVFEEILGQEHIVRILKNQLKSGTVSHAYLFCGTRGTGKTSTARILAKGVNCTSPGESHPCGKCSNCMAIKEGIFLDVIEIDAASHTGVDNIRELRETVKYPPILGRFKIYIIDEVHMLSSGAFNALLKTLEDPPNNVIFILATTEPQKLPATIISRCLRLDFRRLSENTLKEGMREICRKLQVKISDSALGLIAANADGSVRDALSLLDQCVSSAVDEITRQDALDILGMSSEETFIKITEMVIGGDVAGAVLFLHDVLSEGKDVRQFMKEWISHYRALLIFKYIKNPENMLGISEENAARIRRQSKNMDMEHINMGIMEISKTLSDAKWSPQPRILLELCIVKLGTGPEKMTEKVDESKASVSGMEKGRKKADVPSKSKVGGFDGDNSSLEGIWHCVFEAGEAQKGSFNLMRGTALSEISDNHFCVQAENPVTLRFLKENALLLEELMEKQMGKRLVMECFLEGNSEVRNEDDPMEATADKLKERFGITVEFE